MEDIEEKQEITEETTEEKTEIRENQEEAIETDEKKSEETTEVIEGKEETAEKTIEIDKTEEATQVNKEKESKKHKKDKESEKNQKISEKKKTNKKIIVAIITIAIIILAIAMIFAYLMIRPKFKNITIELGSKQSITIEDFLSSNIYKKRAKSITDLSAIDLSQVGETEVKLKYGNKEEKVKLNIVDTTPPKVKFQNIIKYLDYEINPEDFILEKTDLSEMTVELVEAPTIESFSDYKVKIKVKDKYGNETIGECTLTITWFKTEVYIELGNKITVGDIVFDEKEYEDRVSKDELKEIDTSKLGEYEITITDGETEYKAKIIIQDTTPPELELKNITIYDDEKINDYKRFIKNVSDASGEPTTLLKTEIDYTKMGEQEITIEAVDVNGNKTEKTAILTIKKDTDGPVISGAKDMTVNKYQEIDYLAGVKATDAKDGSCNVTVDSSKVNTSVAGTYYATYIAKDKKGNSTTVKRKITVNHDQDDTNAKFEEFYNNYCAGKDIVGMANAVRTNVKYNTNWGGNDPVWYGLTEGKGNCYVHANILKRVLDRAGYTNQIIHLMDNSHYWNLVYVNGVWRHIDGTPSPRHTLGLLTDEQKLADAGLDGKTWDTSMWPAAK